MFWRNADRDGTGPAGCGRRRRPRSLATRLIAWYTGSTFALVLLATVFLYWGMTRVSEQSKQSENDVLHERIQVLRTLLKEGGQNRAEVRWEVELERSGFSSPLVYLRVADRRSSQILESPDMARTLPVSIFPAAAGLEPLGPASRFASPSGRVFLVTAASAPAGEKAEDRYVIQAGLDITSEEILLRDSRYLLWTVLAVSGLISFAFGYHITRKEMRPLLAIVETTRRIRSSTLSERVRLAHLPAELESLAENFNEMLERLEESFARLSRFSADMAHEFRTPLNNLRGEAEVALRRARSAKEYREVLASSLEEYGNLSRIVDSLLFLAMAEWPETPINCERTDLGVELRAILEFHEPAAAEKKLSMKVECDGELWMEVDRVLLRRAVSNLVSNAVAHTPPGGTVALLAEQRDSVIRVTVKDTGAGIAHEHLPHLFDRFYRVNRTNNGNPGGAGLGLSIVKAIMNLHGGAAEIASEPGTGTSAILSFPISRPVRPPSPDSLFGQGR